MPLEPRLGSPARSSRSRSRSVPEEVDEEPEDWEDEDGDEPEHLSSDSQIVTTEDPDGDDQPDENPRHERRGCEEHPGRVGENRGDHCARNLHRSARYMLEEPPGSPRPLPLVRFADKALRA